MSFSFLKIYDIIEIKGGLSVMYSLLDKSIILLILAVTTGISTDSGYTVIIVTSAIACSALMEYISNRYVHLALFAVYTAASFFISDFLLMYPLVCYTLINKNDWKFILISVPLFYMGSGSIPAKTLVILTVVFIAEILMKYKTDKLIQLKNDYIQSRDSLTESSLILEKRISSMMDTQDNEVRLATLNERTRIAREIHDNVGHLLSSSILQLGALIMTVKDDQIKSSLTVLKGTLTEGMNSIRNSVHNLRDDSVDLYLYLNSMVNEFKFCKAVLKYEASSEFDVKLRLNIIAIVKEALSNVIRHSDATEVTVSFIEHPQLYQLIISDNGSKKSNNIDIKTLSPGMGLESMRQRAEAFNGIINIGCEKGFRIFISFRKGKS